MKYYSLIFTIFVFLSPTLQAQPMSAEEEAEIQQLFDDNEWLYEILMPEEYKSSKSPERAKKSFSVHLRDSVKEFPHPDELKHLKFASSARKFQLTGSIKYVGFFPKKYRYNTEVLKDRTVEFTVKVHFKNASSKQFEDMARKIGEAQEIWNRERFDFGVPYQFRFEATRVEDEAQFSVKLKKGTRGPYDSKWNPRWSSYTIAHEIGHMLGLGDEYKTLSGKIDCIVNSLMCAGRVHLPFHHYHVLRRLFLPKAVKDSVIIK